MNFSSPFFETAPRWWVITAAVVMAVAVAACERGEATAPAAAPPTAIDTSAEAAASPASAAPGSDQDASPVATNDPDLGGAIRQGMSYGELSKAMSEHGWEPASGDTCLVNMVGADHAAKCAANPTSQSCAWCRELPALQQCSADGRCLLRFRNTSSGQVLEVGMDGELDSWKNNAPDTMFGVSGWRYPSSGKP